METVIEFVDATKEYGSTKRIGPVTFSIKKGEVAGFLGPNGSGKTTCIRLLLGLMRTTSGTVRIRGLDPISEHRRALKQVGYSPELPNIQTFLTPRELLELVAEELGVPKQETQKEIKDVLEMVGLPSYIDTKVGKFSKGMVQRLSIAKGMIGSPEILVMDEPMIGLDPAGSAHFREVFRSFCKKRGGTIFLSSHIMQEVESLCTSAVMIHNGKLLFDGTIDEVTGKVLGSDYLFVEAEPLSSGIVDAISKISGVEQVVQKDGRTIEIKVKRGDEVRPPVSEAIVKSGVKLYSIGYQQNILERTYIEALKKGN